MATTPRGVVMATGAVRPPDAPQRRVRPRRSAPAGPSPAGDPEVRPLIGGGAVVGNGFVWLAAFRSGVPVADERPSFLIDDDKLHIVRSGRGYAQFSVNDVSRYGTLKLYSPAARFCGDLRVEEGSELHIGKDGTVMALSGPQRCSIRWWPRLLK